MKTLIFLAGSILLTSTILCAQTTPPPTIAGQFGLGFVVGETNGFAGRYQINSRNSLTGALGVWTGERLHIHGDYLWNTYPFNEKKLGVHYGLGLGFGGVRASRNDVGVEIRGNLGLDYRIADSPIDAFLDAAPILVLNSGRASGVYIGFGLRIYP